MAVVTLPKAGKDRAPALRGSVYFYTRYGQIIAAKWPRKRGPAKTPQAIFQTQWFAQARKLHKYAVARQQIAAMQAAAGTPLMPSDITMSMMAGRLLSVQMEDGRYYRPYRAMSDISQMLDLITNVPGKILIRGEEVWEGSDVPTGGGSWWWFDARNIADWTFSTSAHSIKGTRFIPAVEMVVTGALGYFQYGTGESYRALIAKYDATGTITQITQSPIWTAAEDGQSGIPFPLQTTMQKGQNYAICLNRVDGDGTAPMKCTANSANIIALPGVIDGWAAGDVTEWHVGDTIAGHGPPGEYTSIALQLAF